MVEGIGFVAGAVIGSFLNVCIWRLPRRESLWRPGSHCPSCATPIRWFDNLPLLSFLILKGRCRACKAPISWRYPLVEGMNAVGYLILLSKFGVGGITITYAVLFSALLVVAFIDLSHQIIPDRVTLPGIALGLLSASLILPQGFYDSLIGLFLGGGLFYLVALAYPGGMGGGDIKLIAMIGAFLGWRNVLLTILVGATAGSAVGLYLILVKGRSRKDPVPFGPFLALGAAVALFWGREVFQWYALLR